MYDISVTLVFSTRNRSREMLLKKHVGILSSKLSLFPIRKALGISGLLAALLVILALIGAERAIFQVISK